MLEIKKAEIVAVTGREDQYPPEDMWEIAFAGRSNVGKSSLLNLLTKRKKLAKVSSSPGKTRTINFYEINDSFRIVDLPGYGYAKISKSISETWGKMMDDYLKKRPNLMKVILLVDIRHKPTKLDVDMYKFLQHFGLDGIVVATKSDKVSRNHIGKHVKIIKETLGMKEDDKVVTISSLKKTGYENLLEVMYSLLSDDEEMDAEE